jgi:hypothetical protein
VILLQSLIGVEPIIQKIGRTLDSSGIDRNIWLTLMRAIHRPMFFPQSSIELESLEARSTSCHSSFDDCRLPG